MHVDKSPDLLETRRMLWTGKILNMEGQALRPHSVNIDCTSHTDVVLNDLHASALFIHNSTLVNMITSLLQLLRTLANNSSARPERLWEDRNILIQGRNCETSNQS